MKTTMQKNSRLLSVSVTLVLFLSASCSYDKKEPAAADTGIKPFAIIEPANPYVVVDKSPMDISYYPVNYPAQLMSNNDSATLTARVLYSRPHKMGRTIFGTEAPPKCIQQYGAYWRLGANEATEIEFFKAVTVNGQKVMPGRYIIYCIPYPEKWIIVLNNNLFSFGLHQDTAKDVKRFEIPVEKTNDNIEYFTMVFQKSAGGADLIMAWGDVKAALPLAF
jgi:Protein of unknown function (DUF2911)